MDFRQPLLRRNGNGKPLNLISLLKLLVSHWQWFLLSVVICLGLAQLYIKFCTPVYKVSVKMLIKRSDNAGRRSRGLINVQNLGMTRNMLGMDEEIERLWTCKVMRDVARSLKLNTTYTVDDWPRSRNVYGRQPITVDIDPLHLDSMDMLMYDEFRVFTMKLSRKSDKDKGLTVRGMVVIDDEPAVSFSRRLKSLPAVINTPYGTLTFTENNLGEKLTPDKEWTVNIMPAAYTALSYLGRLSVTPFDESSSDSHILRKYYKMSFITKLSLAETDVHRAVDMLRQIQISYNRQATIDKDQVALKTSEFINERIASISEELGSSDNRIEDIKQESGITTISDAISASQQSNKMSVEMLDANSQLKMLDYLSEYINAPENQNDIIPNNIGLNDQASIKLINKYNQVVQQRNQLLHSATGEAPQVKMLTSTARELRTSIIEALRQARQTIAIQQQNTQKQYNRFQGKVYNVPGAEHALNEEGREQAIKSRLYMYLLQKREENNIMLASTADNGILIDEPNVEDMIHPKPWMYYGIGLAAGLGTPILVLFLMGLFRYKITDHEDVTLLTELPIIADIPQANEESKGKAGIVVKANSNEPIDEVFRNLRTNIWFMLKGEGNTIMFTSSTSGEGKTFTAANLAVSFATLGKKVILCGLDIRKPALGRLFDVSDHSQGITNLLAADTLTPEDIHKQIQPSGVADNFDLLLAGPVPPNPTEMLASDNFGVVINRLKEEYDYVILDTAPVGLVTDALQISCYANISVYVCRSGYTPRREFCLVNKLTEENKLPQACIVINGV